MTTVIDPGTESEAVFFNKSGTAILHLSTSGSNNAIAVDGIAGRVILFATNSQPDGPVQGTVNLSSNFQPGDEFWLFSQSIFLVVDENGTTLPTAEKYTKVGGTRNWVT